MLGITTLTSNDIYWHLASGKYIFLNHVIPTKGIFSFSLLNKPWIDHEWALQLILYIYYLLFGFTGLSILKTVIYIFIYSLLLVICRRTCQNNIKLFYIFIIFPIMISSSRLFLRPELFSIIILIFFYYFYNKLKWQHFALIGILWANLHAYFVFGFILIGAEIAARLIKYNKKGMKNSVIHFLSFLAGTLINPYFWRLHYRTIYEARTPVFMKGIGEWGSPFTITYAQVPWSFKFFILYSVLFAAFALIFIYKHKKVLSWRELIFSATLLFFAVRSVRFLPIFGFVTFPIFLKYASEALAPFVNKKAIYGLVAAATALFIILDFLVLTNRFFPPSKSIVTMGFGISPRKYSEQSVKFLNENSNDTRIFNTFECGGFLAFNSKWAKNKDTKRIEPVRKTYIDASFLNKDLFLEYMLFIKYPRVLERYCEIAGINFLFIPYYTGKHFKIIEYFSNNPNWKPVYLDNTVLIFSRNRTMPFFEAKQKSNPGFFSKIGKKFPFGAFNRAIAFASMRKTDKALHYFHEALKQDPKNANILYNLGAFYESMGRLKQAAFFYEKALQFKKNTQMALFGLGKIALRQKDYTKARTLFLRARKINKKYQDFNFFIGETYIFQKKFKEAKYYYSKSKSSQSYNRRGEIAMEEGDFSGAAKLFIKALEITASARYKSNLKKAVDRIETFN